MKTCKAEKDGRTEKSEQAAPGLKHQGSLSHAQHPSPSGCILRVGSGDGGLPQPHLWPVFTSFTIPCVGRGTPQSPDPATSPGSRPSGAGQTVTDLLQPQDSQGPAEREAHLSLCFFVWRNQVFAAAQETFNCSMQTLSCGVWGLVP